jgi:exopolysaccharide production protein ExoQ
MTSWTLWIPLSWVIIVGSRPLSYWFGGGMTDQSLDAYLEGSPLDRNIYIFLIVAGLIVLFKRRLEWGAIFASNRWLFIFLIYCGISVVWSYYPIVGIKRWVKDIGHVIMVLIVLTEKNPIEALRTVIARYTYIAIPISVLLIKYYSEVGRYYHHWTWESAYCGITVEKNTLGAIVFICGIFLVWDLLDRRSMQGIKIGKGNLLGLAILLLMVIWLVKMSGSSTALVCLILGIGIVYFLRPPNTSIRIIYLGILSLLLGFLVLFLSLFTSLFEIVVSAVGRNTTLTGRTDLWVDLLEVPINQIFGTGYQNFWLGPHTEFIWKRFNYHPNQAHNGFLEVYLNGGLVGLSLLIAMIISTGSKLMKELQLGSSQGVLRFSFFLVVLVSNWTEATFNKVSLVWVIMIIATLRYPRPMNVLDEPIMDSINGNTAYASSKS